MDYINVIFALNFCSVITTVPAEPGQDEDEIIEQASRFLMDNEGIDVSHASAEIQAA